MPSRLRALAVLAALPVLAAAPAPASAQDAEPPAERQVFRGQTQQDRGVSLTTGTDRLPERLRIDWVASCRRSEFRYTSRTVDTPPFDEVAVDTLRDVYEYVERSRGGVRATVDVTVRGERTGTGRRERWSGTFRATLVVRRDGRRIDSCRTPTLRWSARRSASSS